MRGQIMELLAEIGLGWGTAGAGTLALLAFSPKARKRARSMLVSAVAAGFKLTQQLTHAGHDLRQEINKVVSEAQLPQQPVLGVDLGPYEPI